jgi:cysteine desulfuration protein SufE
MMNYDEIKKLLSGITDPAMKLEMVMDFGARLAQVPDGATCSEITGCASHVEICRLGNRFYACADSAIVRGIVAILLSMVDGHTPDEIRQMDLAQMFSGLELNLGAGRLNGVNSMIRFLQNL